MIDQAWLALSVLAVRVFEHRERIAYCAPCNAWYRAETHQHV